MLTYFLYDRIQDTDSSWNFSKERYLGNSSNDNNNFWKLEKTEQRKLVRIAGLDIEKSRKWKFFEKSFAFSEKIVGSSETVAVAQNVPSPFAEQGSGEVPIPFCGSAKSRTQTDTGPEKCGIEKRSVSHGRGWRDERNKVSWNLLKKFVFVFSPLYNIKNVCFFFKLKLITN